VKRVLKKRLPLHPPHVSLYSQAPHLTFKPFLCLVVEDFYAGHAIE